MVFTSTHSAGLGIAGGALAVGLVTGLLQRRRHRLRPRQRGDRHPGHLRRLRGLANLISNGTRPGLHRHRPDVHLPGPRQHRRHPVLVWMLIVVAVVVAPDAALHRHRPQHLRHGRQRRPPPAWPASTSTATSSAATCWPASSPPSPASCSPPGPGPDSPPPAARASNCSRSPPRRWAASPCRAARAASPARSWRWSCSGVLQNGLTILNVNSFWQDIAQGALLVVAVVIQQRRGGQPGLRSAAMTETDGVARAAKPLPAAALKQTGVMAILRYRDGGDVGSRDATHSSPAESGSWRSPCDTPGGLGGVGRSPRPAGHPSRRAGTVTEVAAGASGGRRRRHVRGQSRL